MMRINVVLALLGNRLRLHRAVRVHRIAQLLRRLEEGNALRRNIHLRSGLRVASRARIALPRPETAKSANLDLVPGLQGSDHGIKKRIDNDLTIATCEGAFCGDLVYRIGFSTLGPRLKIILLVDYRRDRAPLSHTESEVCITSTSLR